MSREKTTGGDDSRGIDRRGLLKAALGSGAAVTAVAVVGADASAKPETKDERKKARYRETDHVKTFYLTNRD